MKEKSWVGYINLNFHKWLEPLMGLIEEENPIIGKNGDVLKKPKIHILTRLITLLASPELSVQAKKAGKSPIELLESFVEDDKEGWDGRRVIEDFVAGMPAVNRERYDLSVSKNDPRAELCVVGDSDRAV